MRQTDEIAADVLRCALSHLPDVCLMGNVTAAEVAHVAAEVALLRRQVKVLCELAVEHVTMLTHGSVSHGNTAAHWREWSAARAKEGV